MTLDERPQKLRWPRSQKFVLTERGRLAEADYREKIVSSRDAPGRASFDAARATWASVHLLKVDDGLYLAELAGGAGTLPKLIEALETCGKNRVDAVSALERLADGGMIVAS